MDTPSRRPRMGGGQHLSVVAAGGPDLVDSLLSLSEGGAKLATGFSDRIRETYGVTVHLHVPQHASNGSAGTLETLRAAATVVASAEDGSSASESPHPDVVVLSLDPKNDGDAEAFGRNLREVVSFVKNDLQAHVVIYNASTVDPEDAASNYAQVDDTQALRLHRLNLALMWLSIETGISIIDVDRLIADVGADAHVQALQDYSAEVCGLICDEFIRVLADYGFFEERPLVAQVGRETR